jgi:hypothetical protein
MIRGEAMTADHENSALEQAANRIAETGEIEHWIWENSLPIMGEQASMVQEALVLLDAATSIAIKPETLDPRERAIRILASTLQHLIQHGWNGVLTGHYPGAIQSLRLIGEMSDHMAACRFSEAGAQWLLDLKEWKLGDAVKLLERELAVLARRRRRLGQTSGDGFEMMSKRSPTLAAF